jgi:hypothetical protein
MKLTLEFVAKNVVTESEMVALLLRMIKNIVLYTITMNLGTFA